MVSPTRLLPSSLQFAQATSSCLRSSNGECGGHRSCHTVVSTVPAVKWLYGQHCWILKPLKVQALASLKTCWGSPGVSLKKTHVHTHIQTLWHTLCISGGTTACLFIFSSHPLIPSDTHHSCDHLYSI